MFAIHVPGQSLYEHNPKRIHLRHTFAFHSLLVRFKSAKATKLCRNLFARATQLANKVRRWGTFAPKTCFIRLSCAIAPEIRMNSERLIFRALFVRHTCLYLVCTQTKWILYGYRPSRAYQRPNAIYI